MLDNPTDLPACASPGGASPLPTQTPDAGAQTGRPVVRCDEWPTDGRTLTAATVQIGDTVYPVIVGLDPDAVGCGTSTGPAAYVADFGDVPDDQCEAVDRAVSEAWRCEVLS